jgi:transcriptional regulator with XRE-family HTH domain
MKLRQAFGEVIRETRLERKMTLRDLALESSVALGYLSEIERGQKEASSEIIDSVASGLGMSLSELVVQTGYRIMLNEPAVEPENRLEFARVY